MRQERQTISCREREREIEALTFPVTTTTKIIQLFHSFAKSCVLLHSIYSSPWSRVPDGGTRLDELLDFGQLWKAFGNFCKGLKIFNFTSEIIFGQLNRHLAIFYCSHWSRSFFRVYWKVYFNCLVGKGKKIWVHSIFVFVCKIPVRLGGWMVLGISLTEVPGSTPVL